MGPLNKKFPKLTKEELLEAAQCLDRGSNPQYCENCIIFPCNDCPCMGLSVSDVVTEAHIPMVFTTVDAFVNANTAELLAVGLLALTRGVNVLPSDVRDVSNYLASWVRNEIRKHLLLDNIIRRPLHLVKQRYNATYSSLGLESISVHSEEGLVDLREILDDLPVNRNQRIVLTCLEEGGFSLRDMSEMCGVSFQRIGQIKTILLNRLSLRLREINDE
jgi:DNA-directed RNA polymerase specialized sigma24 family protein